MELGRRLRRHVSKSCPLSVLRWDFGKGKVENTVQFRVGYILSVVGSILFVVLMHVVGELVSSSLKTSHESLDWSCSNVNDICHMDWLLHCPLASLCFVFVFVFFLFSFVSLVAA